MNGQSLKLALLGCFLCLATVGCKDAPGKPKLESEALRPDQVLDFPTLYRQNCAACHGENGKNGAAISLANPVYLSMVGGDTIQRFTAAGIPGSLMPAFSKGAGGMLTDRQIGVPRAWHGRDVGTSRCNRRCATASVRKQLSR